MKKTKYHPLIYGYLKKYQEDPNSRVFAPLAEAYRKAGLIDEAIEIATDGLKLHPHFIGGRVALARALFEKKRYTDVIRELDVVLEDAPDNLVAQRLRAESCLMLGRAQEALESYKMLLYFSPSDQETAQLVKELESAAYEQGNLLVRAEQFDVRSASDALREPKHPWIRKVEFLQGLLLRIERRRGASSP